jgi:alkyldihydroxyacetonephosphate synthase
VVETFETATTWDRAGGPHATLRETAQRAPRRCAGTPSSPSGPPTPTPTASRPYLTVIAPGPAGRWAATDRTDRIARGRAAAGAWDEVKGAVGEVLHRLGATATHHHAVGRDHRPVYDRQRPAPFAAALAAARDAVDPDGVLNPGVLLDPRPGSVGAQALGFGGAPATA